MHTWNCVHSLNSVGGEQRNSGCLVKWILAFLMPKKIQPEVAVKSHPVLLPFLHSLKWELGQQLSLDLAASSALQSCPKG